METFKIGEIVVTSTTKGPYSHKMVITGIVDRGQGETAQYLVFHMNCGDPREHIIPAVAIAKYEDSDK